MKQTNFSNLSACELTMLAASTATSLTNNLSPEEINELQNFLHLLGENINAIKCQKQFCLSCRQKKDGSPPPHY